MPGIVGELLSGGVVLLWLIGTAIAQEQSSPSPAPPEVRMLIEKLQTLRIPETASFLRTVDPKLFAETLKTPEGRWAMDLAARWSTRRPDTGTDSGKLAVQEFVEKLSREFALVPSSVLVPLGHWRLIGCPEFTDLPDEEQQQILDTQDALREGFFLGQLTPEQREAVYQLEDLRLQHFKRDASIAEIKRDYYALFRQWGQEKLRQVLEGRWSAAEFLKAFRDVFVDEERKWKLSAMPSWFWAELVRFTEGPDAYPAFSLLPRSPFSSGWTAKDGLAILSNTLKDERMGKAVDALGEQLYPSTGAE